LGGTAPRNHYAIPRGIRWTDELHLINLSRGCRDSHSLPFQSDVRDPEAIARFFDQATQAFPNLNVLINNAGIMRKIKLQLVAFIVLAMPKTLMTPLQVVGGAQPGSFK
jgi:NAD(P)-dependent dehydrogenase (short-subunit alcohol dehydrogenase family)